ncbi:MAG: type III pantothenate kinase [Bacteroidetes bacterium]|nr:type III pantothenate kinase [Bacteroidota bacterium]
MNLIIDIGNTRTKVFVFDGERLLADHTFRKLTSALLSKILSGHNFDASILSSVVKTGSATAKLLRKKTDFVQLSQNTSLPFRNEYKSKETLGNDRVANAAGALKTFPGKHCLIIDAGTCVKYDFINKSKKYLGGAISPGLMMRYRALHQFTSKLPLVKPSGSVQLTGKTTKESIISGVQLGILNEMEGYIRQYSLKYKGLKVILTGGDAVYFAHLLNFPIFAAPKLTAIGLNEILQHNLEKK